MAGGVTNISYMDASKPRVYEMQNKGSPSSKQPEKDTSIKTSRSPGSDVSETHEETPESVTVQHSPALSLYYHLHSDYVTKQATKQSLQQYHQFKRLSRYNKHVVRKHSDSVGRKDIRDGHHQEQEGEMVTNTMWEGALSVFSMSGKHTTPTTTSVTTTNNDDDNGDEGDRNLSKDMYDEDDENDGTSGKGVSLRDDHNLDDDNNIAMSVSTKSRKSHKHKKSRRKTAAVSEEEFEETRRRKQFLEVEVDISNIVVEDSTTGTAAAIAPATGERQEENASAAYAAEGLRLEGEDLEEALLHSYLHAHIRFDAIFEVNSHVYLPYSISALMNLYDFSSDQAIKSMARKVIDIIVKQVLLCTTDTGVCCLSASARAFTRTRQRVHGHNLNQLIRMIVGDSPDDLWPSPITDFLTTTSWRPSDELKQYYELQGRVAMRVSFPLDDVKELFPGIPEHERVPLYWSAGLVVHPDFIEETKKFQKRKHMEHQVRILS